jgi:hypothetical protein
VIGFGDDEDATRMSANATIYGDGRALVTVQASLGHPRAVDINVAGVLRLRISASLVQSQSDGRTGVKVALGDGKLTGT